MPRVGPPRVQPLPSESVTTGTSGPRPAPSAPREGDLEAAATSARPLTEADRLRLGLSAAPESPPASTTAAASLHGRVGGGFTSNGVGVVVGDEATLAEAIRLIRGARHSVRFETFLLNGPHGEALGSELVAAASRGVRVQVLLDPNVLQEGGAVGRVLNPEGKNLVVPSRLRQVPGIEVREFNKKTMNAVTFGSRGDHAKLLAVDGAVALMGGTNFDQDVNHDANLVIRGPAVDDLTAHFDEGWVGAGGTLLPGTPAPSPASGEAVGSDAQVRILSTGPGGRTSKADVLAQIRQARESVWLEMLALTDGEVIDELVQAKARGIDVRVILYDNVSSGPLAWLTGNYPNWQTMYDFCRDGRAVPLKLFEPLPAGQMHTKMMIVDRRTVLIGSTNYTPQEFEAVHNYVAVVRSEDVASRLGGVFENDWNHRSSDRKIRDYLENEALGR